MSEGRCGTCRYFDMWHSHSDYAICQKLDGETVDAELAYMSGEYPSLLYVKPDFGCVLWEPKPQEPIPAPDSSDGEDPRTESLPSGPC